MKKIQTYILGMITFLLMSIGIYASDSAKIITTPLDSRPISTTYLENLVHLGGDDFESVSKTSLDYFTSVPGIQNRFANSALVRRQFEELVRQASLQADNQQQSQEIVAIINLASYLNGGLIGSRCGVNYQNQEDGYADLYSLVTTYQDPTYYLHVTMPRTLPETRNHTIWPNNDKVQGLGYYYLTYHTTISPGVKTYVTNHFSRVTPEQFLMEWAYVQNKKEELGESALATWERAFLEASQTYVQNPIYSQYLENYKKPFEGTLKTTQQLLFMEQQGLVHEIVISADDFQLPDSVLYLFTNTKESWIQVENNTPTKFSFARTNMKKIEEEIAKAYGTPALQLSKQGLHSNINFIYGTDEIPQLIYARDFSRRSEKTTSIRTFSHSDTLIAGRYDVYTPNRLLQNALNFVSKAILPTQETIDLYLYDYNTAAVNEGALFNQMMDSIRQGNEFGLIEIYSEEALAKGENPLFEKLLSNTWGVNLTDLVTYSAWNTNANAIGLGVAHAQVYGISNEIATDRHAFIKNHLKILVGHILEDGIFTGQGKALLRSQGFTPSYKDMFESNKLLEILRFNEVKTLFSSYEKEGIRLGDLVLLEYNFPWGRNFECFIKLGVLTY